jgi:hypothetical protein
MQNAWFFILRIIDIFFDKITPVNSLNTFNLEIFIMTDFFNQDSWRSLHCDLAYEQMLEKVLNENPVQVHTMLMKTEIEQFVANHHNVFDEQQPAIRASLFDYAQFEKELTDGDKTR